MRAEPPHDEPLECDLAPGRSAAGQSPARGPRQMELRDLAAGIGRRWRLFVVFFLLLFAGAVAGTYLKRPAYESSAKLLVNFEGLGVSLSRAEVPATAPPVQAVEAVTSQVELLTSRDLVVKLVDRIGVEGFRGPPPGNALLRAAVNALEAVAKTVAGGLQKLGLVERVGERDALIEAVATSIRVFPVRQSQIIAVSMRWRTPVVPPLALKTLLDLFEKKSVEIDTRRNEYILFTGQVDQAALALNEAEAELRAFETAHDVADLGREKQTLIDRIDQLTALGEPAGAPISGPDAGAPTLDVSASGDGIVDLRSRASDLRTERAKALATFTPENRAVKELDSQIAEVDAALARGLARVAGTIAALRQRLHALQSVEQDYNRIRRNIDIATEALQTYRKVVSDRRNMLAHETVVHVQVVDPPGQPIRAVGPSRLIWAVGGLFLSLVAAALGTLLVDLLASRRAARAPRPGAPGHPDFLSGTARLASSATAP